jgi:threonylcarbamoyladenosine tRNA methylthiotransferase MtaB
MKTVKFYTLGCKVNQYETQEMRESFLRHGFKELTNGKKADVFVINTCTVTHKADRESLYYIHRSYRANSRAKIIVTGCMAQLDQGLLKRQKGVTMVVKNREKNSIPATLFANKKNSVYGVSQHCCGISDFKGHSRAFLKIQDGCDNFCSYCKVPLVRGKSISKPLEKISEEAKRLVANGFKEIVLTGICLGNFGKDLHPKGSLIKAIEALECIQGLARIRLSSIEPQDITDALIAKISVSEKICPHLHIPLQSGDDRVLKRMRRKYTAAYFRSMVKRAIPGLAVTTDCLVGFPGETDEAFQNTLRLIKEIMPLKVHVFPYSLRLGTAAAGFKNQVNPKIAQEGKKVLEQVARGCQVSFTKRFLRKDMPVLVEGRVKDAKGEWEGHTANYLKVRFAAAGLLKNKFATVRLGQIRGDTIVGRQVTKSQIANY